MKMFLAAVLVAFAAMPALAQTASVPDWPACEVRGGGTANDASPSITARMRVRTGGECSSRWNGSAGRYEVVNGPSHGVVSVDGQTVRYQPAPGFTGTDAFVVRYRMASGGSTRPWFVTFNVEVR